MQRMRELMRDAPDLAKREPMFTAEAKERKSAACSEAGTRGGRGNRKGSVQKNGTLSAKGSGDARTRAANAVGVSTASVQRMRELMRDAPDLAKREPMFTAEAKERQREHGGTAPGRKANTSGQKNGSVPKGSGDARTRAHREPHGGGQPDDQQHGEREAEAEPEPVRDLDREAPADAEHVGIIHARDARGAGWVSRRVGRNR